MHARFSLVLQTAFAISMMSMAAAMPLPEASTTQSVGADTVDVAAPAHNASSDLAGVKDETRLPMEPADAPAEAAPAPVAKAKVEPKPVPELTRAEFCTTLAASAEKHNVPVPLFANLIWQESRFRPQAVSPVGALGVAQFMPAVAQEVGLKNPFNPLEALPAAARFFRGLVERFGSLGLATAAYNAGSGRVGNWLAKRTKVLPKETQNYVRVITGRPVDHWRSATSKGATITMTAAMPCRQEAVFAKFDQTDLPERRQTIAQTAGIKAVRVALSTHRAGAKSVAGIKVVRLALSKSRAASTPRARHIAAVAHKAVAAARSRVAGHRHDARIRVASRR